MSVQAGVKSSAEAHQGLLDVVRIASGDYTLDLTTEPAPAEAVGPFSTALDAAILAQAKAYGSQVEVALLALKAGEPPAGSGGGSGGTEIRRQPVFGTLLILAGVALTGWAGKKGVDKVVDARAKPVADKIGAATPAELSIIKDELRIDPGASKEETLAHFKGLGMIAKHRAVNNVESALFEVANARVARPDVVEVDAGEIRTSVAKSAVASGELAVNTTVSLSTSVTGGQGFTKALEAVGMGAKAAEIVDLGITAVSTATDTPLQPLDVLGASLNVTVASKKTTPITVPAPQVRVEASQAVGVLSSRTATAVEQDDAAGSLALDVIEAYADDLAPRTEADGAVTVDVPVKVHMVQLDEPTVVQELVIPQAPGDGRADILVAATGMVPKVYEDVDTRSSVTLEYPAVSVKAVEESDPPAGWEPWCQGEGEWACDDEDCITDGQICDGVPDCTNGADEGDWCSGGSSECDEDEFDCADGDKLEPGVECIPLFNRCNGNIDCFLSDQDEVGCE